jgi:proteasome lid subunit RPN8/RPN11
VISAPPALTIPPAVAASMLAHAREELPNEACGLLAGNGETGVVTTYHPGRNVLRSPLRFDLHPDDLVRITFAIEAAGEDLVAIFHSHVRTAAIPSASDAREARYRVPYVIASLAQAASPLAGALRGWAIDEGEPRELELRFGS